MIHVDPITGVMSNIEEPVYETQATSVVETTELLLLSGLPAECETAAEARSQVRVTSFVAAAN